MLLKMRKIRKIATMNLIISRVPVIGCSSYYGGLNIYIRALIPQKGRISICTHQAHRPGEICEFPIFVVFFRPSVVFSGGVYWGAPFSEKILPY